MQKTALLDKYRSKKKQRTELLRAEMLSKIKAALSALSEEISFEAAYVFGSILRSSFSEDSDIDIAFTGLADKDFFKAMAFLSSILERDVDVIQLEGHRLREKVLKEGLFINKETYTEKARGIVKGKLSMKDLEEFYEEKSSAEGDIVPS